MEIIKTLLVQENNIRHNRYSKIIDKSHAIEKDSSNSNLVINYIQEDEALGTFQTTNYSTLNIAERKWDKKRNFYKNINLSKGMWKFRKQFWTLSFNYNIEFIHTPQLVFDYFKTFQ